MLGKPILRGLYAAAIVVAIPLIAWNGFIQQADDQAADLLMRLRPPQRSAWAERIVLIAIDDRTASLYGPLPLRRSVLARGLEALAKSRPRVLAVDLLLPEASSPEEDQALAKALRAFPRVIHAAAIGSDPEPQPRWILPLPPLRLSARVAHVHASPDPDGVVRSVLLAKSAGRERYWAMAVEASALATGAGRPLESPDSLSLAHVRIPATAKSSRLMRVNYLGPEGAFRRISFASLLEGETTGADFTGKVAIVGVTAQGGGDRLFTPYSSGLGMSGIEIHANAMRTILDGAFLTPLTPPAELMLLAAIAAGCLVLVRQHRGARLAVVLLLFAALLPAVCMFTLWLGFVWPLAAMAGVYFFSTVIAGAGEYAAMALSLRRAERLRRDYASRVQEIAHEIKSPLTAIQGSSEMLSDQSFPESQRATMAGLIHKESKRLTSLIQTFLNVERLAAGALTLEKREVDLHALCEDVVERGRLYAARKRIRVEAEIPPIRLAADPDLLSFAIYNLITNGVKYSPRDTRILLAATESGGNLLISVSDQGYGIASHEQEKIFEKFYRLKRDEKGGEEGTGIGLALVKGIVVQHGGRITVESKPGAGSRFTIMLPKD